MDAACRATRILDAAEKRMRRDGFNAVSFRELAGDVDVKSASVHYHFPTKADLGLALVERYRRRFFESLDLKTARTRSARQKLVIFSESYRNALQKGGAICLCGMLGAESAGLPKHVQRAVQKFFEANIAWVAAVLAEQRPQRASRDEAVALVAGLQGALILSASLSKLSIYDSAARHLLAPYRD